MNVRRSWLLSLTCLFLPALGFALTCIGAYLVSLQTAPGLKTISIYIVIVVGFLAMLIGVTYTLCHSLKSKMYQRRQRERHIQIFTVERPSSFPPSYEESQRSQMYPDHVREVAVDGVDIVMGLAPPLYSQDSSETPDCTWSWEQPPLYSQVVHIQHGHTEDAGELREVVSAR
ncbi:transmembrane protein 252-like [Odontesthes bonariensis]